MNRKTQSFYLNNKNQVNRNMSNSTSKDGVQRTSNIQHISWDDLDKRKYYTIGPAIMLGVRLLIYPPMLIKTRLQVQTQSSFYNGTWDAFKKIFKFEGFRGFYRGFGTNTLNLLSGQLYVTTFELTRANVPVSNQAYKSLIAGCMASLAGQSLTVPIDIISQKQMMEGLKLSSTTKSIKLKSAFTVSKEILRTSGMPGFYKGFFASLMTYAPSSGIWWSSYYTFTQFYGQYRPDGVPNLVIQGMSGPSASVVAAVLTNPADTIKTRLQVDSRKRGIIAVALNLYKEEGIRALHKGLTARLLLSIPAGFILSVSYELVKKLSVKSTKEKEDV